MKKLLSLLIVSLPFIGKTQNAFYEAQTTQTNYTTIMQIPISEFLSRNRILFEFTDSVDCHLNVNRFHLDEYYDRNDGVISGKLLWLNDSTVMSSPVSSLIFPFSNVSGFDSLSVISALGYTPLASEVDGSTTNEIELPLQTGNNTRLLTTNGFSASWVDIFPVPTVISSGARNFNQAYQISYTRPAKISVSTTVTCALSLAGGQAGNIQLQISANGTSGWITVGQITGSNTGTLTIGLNTSQASGGQMDVDLPVGYYWRIITNNTTGTPAYTFDGGYEIIY